MFQIGRYLRWLGIMVLLAPILSLMVMALMPGGDDVRHLVDTVLSRYILNSVILVIGIACLTTIIGVGTAWLVSGYSFTGVRFFSVSLYLPLALPAYIVAFVYGGMFDYAGPVQSYIRELFGWQKGDYWFPEVRSVGGAVCILSFVLYPYVYMLSRLALSHSNEVMLAGRSMGLSSWKAFVSVGVPFIRPAIIGGVILACMETLGEFGAMQFLAVDTFTTGIYRTWFGMHNPVAASVLSVMLFALVMICIAFEYYSRGRAQYGDDAGTELHKEKLTGWYNFAAFMFCMLPVFVGFVLPVGGLIHSSVASYTPHSFDELATFVENTLLVAISAAVVTVLVGFMVSYLLTFSKRMRVSRVERMGWWMGSLGYAIPGSVIAVGIVVFYGEIDQKLNDIWQTGLLLSGTFFALVMAYLFRFLTVSVNTIDSAMHCITPEIDRAARVLGGTYHQVLRLYMPMLRNALWVAGLLVFVECVKELPATLIIRPFNFETLATRTYSLASDEQLDESALPALLIVLMSLLPVYLVCRSERK